MSNLWNQRAIPNPDTRRTLRTALLFVAALTGGCATHETPTFSFSGTNLTWPAPPDPPRIRYIGEITGEASLGRKKSTAEVLNEIFQGPKPLIGFSTPVAVAAQGHRVWVADPAHPTGPCVHVIDFDAHTMTQIRDAAGTALQWPIDVAADGGRVAIADARRAVVYVQTTSNGAFRAIGLGVLRRPSSVAWFDGGVVVLDAAAHAVIAFDAAGRERFRFGERGVSPGAFNFPSGLCIFRDGGASASQLQFAVADAMNFRVQVLSLQGAPSRVFGKKGDAAGDFSLPRDVAADSAGRLYVLDNQFENVQIFDRDGSLLMALGRGGSGAGQFNLPSGVTIDTEDRIWIADTYNRRVQVFALLPESQS